MSNSISYSRPKWDLWMVAALVCVAVVLGCVRTLPNGLDNLYFSRRIDAAAELYKAGKVDCLIVSGDNHVKGYDEPSDMKESLAKIAAVLDVILRRSPKFLGPREALPGVLKESGSSS